jgi:hypothetical protein
LKHVVTINLTQQQEFFFLRNSNFYPMHLYCLACWLACGGGGGGGGGGGA